MENKEYTKEEIEEYYTPEIEDIHSGYEYEVKRRNGNWEKINEFSNAYDYEDNPHYAIMKDMDAGNIRVPYLTKEQILSEGWEVGSHRAYFEILKDISDIEIANKEVEDRIYNLIYHIPNKWLTIKMQDLSGSIKEDKPIHTIYYGKCLDVNQFRKLMSWLNIK